MEDKIISFTMFKPDTLKNVMGIMEKRLFKEKTVPKIQSWLK